MSSVGVARCGGAGAGDEFAVDGGGVAVPVRKQHPDGRSDLKVVRAARSRVRDALGNGGCIRQPSPHGAVRDIQALRRGVDVPAGQPVLEADPLEWTP